MTTIHYYRLTIEQACKVINSYMLEPTTVVLVIHNVLPATPAADTQYTLGAVLSAAIATSSDKYIISLAADSQTPISSADLATLDQAMTYFISSGEAQSNLFFRYIAL